MAQFGYNRDRKKGKLQIVFGLLCNPQGCPIAVEVFEGNTGDPTTLPKQVEKVRSRFGIERLVWVADRGMITQARIKEDLQLLELDWITALRSNQIRVLVETDAIQLSLFDQQDLAEITSPDYQGERLIACPNPLLAQSRAQKREELLQVLKNHLPQFTQTLNDREKQLLKERLLSEEPKTLQEVADRYGLTRERARQIETVVIQKLRDFLKPHLK